jgi:DNA-binding MarR family transcriptional regulator
MTEFHRLSELMERIIHKYNQVENKKRIYGANVLLTRTEIHTIVAVGEHPGLNVTELAQKQGVTKGAASQMIYKLVDKGFINKTVSPDSDTEVCLMLTEMGNTAFEGHRKYHESNSNRFFKIIRDMSPELMQQFEYTLKKFDEFLDESLKE